MATAHARLGSAASAFLRGQHQLLIDGKWKNATSGKSFDVFDPATGQAIAAIAEADAADIDDAPSRPAPGRRPRRKIAAS